jgi:hypothetical protein
MKKLLLSALVLLTPIFLFSQVNTVSLELEEWQMVDGSFYIPDKGLFLLTKRFGTSDNEKKWEVMQYSPTGELLWFVTVPKYQGSKSVASWIVGSAYSDFIYHIESQTNAKVDGMYRTFITQIKDGEARLYEVHDLGKIFDWVVTAKGLHAIRTEDARDGEFELYYWDHEQFEMQQVLLDLPDFDRKDKFTDWWFHSHTSDQFYFIRKNIGRGIVQKSKEFFEAEIATISLEGELVSITRKKIELKDGHLIGPHVDVTYSTGALISYTGTTYSSYSSTQDNPLFTTPSRSSATGGFTWDMFGRFYFEDSGEYYVYGIYDDVDEKGANANGVFLQHYNASGEIIHEGVYQFARGLEHGLSYAATTPQLMRVRFNRMPEQGFVLEFLQIRHAFTWDFNDEQELLSKAYLNIREEYQEIKAESPGFTNLCPEQKSFVPKALKRVNMRGYPSFVDRYLGLDGKYVLMVTSGWNVEIGFFGE